MNNSSDARCTPYNLPKLNSLQCTEWGPVCKVHSTVYIAQYTVNTVRCTFNHVNFVFILLCTVSTVNLIVQHSAQCATYTVSCTEGNVQCTLFSAQCVLYSEVLENMMK